MKAILFNGYGKLKDHILLQDIPTPVPAENEVLVQIFAASINPVDYKIVHGAMRLLHRFKLPQTLGFDLSGIVVSVGKNVSEFNIGQEVYGAAQVVISGWFGGWVKSDRLSETVLSIG